MNGFQHEQPDYWLTFGNPWEIERLIVSYPIKFYGHVSVHNEEGRQVRDWRHCHCGKPCVPQHMLPGWLCRAAGAVGTLPGQTRHVMMQGFYTHMRKHVVL